MSSAYYSLTEAEKTEIVQQATEEVEEFRGSNQQYKNFERKRDELAKRCKEDCSLGRVGESCISLPPSQRSRPWRP